ncbi:MAG: hypothetical protein ACPGII_09960 [Opitutales bacterium]|jgi:hypothetical protein
MKKYKTAQGNPYYIDGSHAFVTIGGNRLISWIDLEDLERWVDSQY